MKKCSEQGTVLVSPQAVVSPLQTHVDPLLRAAGAGALQIPGLPCQGSLVCSASRWHQKQTGRQKEGRHSLLLVWSLSCQLLPCTSPRAGKQQGKPPGLFRLCGGAIDKKQEPRGCAESTQVKQWGGSIRKTPRGQQQGQGEGGPLT